MATRSTIKIEGINYAKVYKHWDGNPEATLPWLESFNQDFCDKRGDDPQYKFAQLLRSSGRDAEQYRLDGSAYTGWGVIGYDSNAGEEFEYILHTNGSVTYKAL